MVGEPLDIVHPLATPMSSSSSSSSSSRSRIGVIYGVPIVERGKSSAQLAAGRKKGNILFNDALNTFYLRLYGVGYIVKDHSDTQR